jgi:hypothetical protein
MISFDQKATLRMLPGNTISDSTFTTIRKWLHTCMSNHDRCARTDIVRTSANLDEIRFLRIHNNHVVLTDSVIPDRYACLSHCWGSGKNIFKTTRANIQEHKDEGITLSRLPKTFQDTIQVCQELEINYVWIDSLCIIQDDPLDWEKQAHRMADVYQNALVTIAALKANDPVEGLFSSVHWPYQGEILPGFTDVYVRRLPPPIMDNDYELEFRYEGSQEKNIWPLLSRGWVYQELWLSTRVIHYGAHEVSWHCHSTIERESTTVIYPNKLEKRRSFHAGDIHNLRSQWYKAVQAYAWRHFTFSKDRSPAFAAIAQKMQELRPNDEYMAGLWRNTLLFDLMWSFIHDEEQRHLDINHSLARIPTWSWMRIRGAIKWITKPHDTYLKNVELLSAAYTRYSPAFPDSGSSSHVTIRAPIIDISTLRSRKKARTAQHFVSPQSAAVLDDGAFELVYLRHHWDLTDDFIHARKTIGGDEEGSSSSSEESSIETSSESSGESSDSYHGSEVRSSADEEVLSEGKEIFREGKVASNVREHFVSECEDSNSRETYDEGKGPTTYAMPLTTAQTWIGSYPFTAIMEVALTSPESDTIPHFPGAKRFKRVGLTELWCASKFPTSHRPDGFDYDAEGEMEYKETLRYIENLEAHVVTLI